MSVDALRGFDMFWIIGADALVHALNEMSQTPVTRFLAYELDHAEWKGFHFYDLIFPLFVFIAGVSLVFSLGRTMQQAGRAAALTRLIRRSVLLFALGIFYYGGLSHHWPDIRLTGVLNRIALVYLLAGLCFCFFRPRTLVAICVALLAGYWALMTFVPIRDVQLTKSSLGALADRLGDAQNAALLRAAGNPSAVKNSMAWAAAESMFHATTNLVSGKYEPGLNVADHFDFQFLPGKKLDDFYDPEGILSTIPALVTGLLGVLAGLLLGNPNLHDKRKLVWLVSLGLAGVLLGWLWNIEFPVVKKIWTSSYVLVAGGYSAILLALFYWLVDVLRFESWCEPFVWMGTNSITIYLADRLIGFEKVASRLMGGDVKAWLDAHVAQGLGALMISVAGLLLAFWVVRFLYHHKLFLRI